MEKRFALVCSTRVNHYVNLICIVHFKSTSKCIVCYKLFISIIICDLYIFGFDLYILTQKQNNVPPKIQDPSVSSTATRK